MKHRFSGKVALVTGSARGIGLAIARALGREGATVMLSDVLDGPLARAAEGLHAEGIAVRSRKTDIADPGQCRDLVDAVLDRDGRLDVLVNNAGISIVAPFAETRPEVCKKLVDVNVLGSMYMTAAALEALTRARGSVVFVASVSGVRAIPSGAVYSASKAALRSFAEGLRLELHDHGVHVGVVSPGFTPTEASKTVMRGDGTARPIDRPAHDTPEGVARQTVALIAGRERERVLTPLGKATHLLQRLSPTLVDHVLRRMAFKN